MRAGLAAALIAAHAVRRSSLGGFPAGGCPPAAAGQERPAAMRQESWRGRRPGDPPPHGPARAPRHLPCRRAAREGRETSPCTRHWRRGGPCPNAPRPAHPGRRAAGKKKQKKRRRPPAAAVERSVAIAPVCLVVGRLEVRNAATTLWVDAAYSPPLWSLRCRALPGPLSCRTNHSVPVGIAAWIFALAPDALDFLVRGHAWATRRGPHAACHCRVRRIGAQPSPWNDPPGAPGVGLPPLSPPPPFRARPVGIYRVQGAHRPRSTVPAVPRCGAPRPASAPPPHPAGRPAGRAQRS